LAIVDLIGAAVSQMSMMRIVPPAANP
jgi:hypothetical protein